MRSDLNYLAPPESALLQLEAELCRAKMREKYWDGVNSVSGAIGRMLDIFREHRNRLMLEHPDSELTQKMLCAAVRNVAIEDLGSRDFNPFNKFLNGITPISKPPADWLPTARAALRFILLGEVRNHEGENDPAEGSRRNVAERINRFFFPQVDEELKYQGKIDRNWDATWFFHEELRFVFVPFSTSDVIGELRSLAYDARGQRASCTIVRASGGRPFPQVNERNELGKTAEVSISCLRNGVRIVYVFPADTEAQLSFHKFKEIVKRESDGAGLIANLQHLEIDPAVTVEIEGRQRWAGEFLGPTLTWVHYQRSFQHRAPHEIPRDAELLLGIHHSKDGTRLICFNHHDCEDFLSWRVAMEQAVAGRDKSKSKGSVSRVSDQA